MENLNMVQFVMNAAIELADYEDSIQGAETYEDAEACAKEMLGYIHCLDTISSTAAAEEGNEYFTNDFDEALNDWEAKCYQALADKARETHQDPDLISQLLKKHDKLREQ